MIGYVTVGSNDLPRAVAFFDELFKTIGAGRFMEEEGKWVAWAVNPEAPGVAVTLPFDGKPASAGNGTMVALMMDSTDKVNALHAKALELGAQDEGAPGERMPGFYAGYFRDLDGNKFNAFCQTPTE